MAANGSAADAHAEHHGAAVTNASANAAADAAAPKWPGWPGYNVFRMIIPVMKVGSIIGRKGELIKKMCEETGAKIRILDGVIGTNDRVVLISGKEEPEAKLSPAMDAALRVFKRANGLTESDSSAATLPACFVRLLVGSSQAISLIGKGGVTIKGIQEESGASIRVLNAEELPFYASNDERIVDIQGESLKVLKALELVMENLRKFLVDSSIIPLFDKTHNTPSTTSATQESKPLSLPASQAGIASEFPSTLKRDSLFREPEPQLDLQLQRSGISLYGQDPALSGISSSLAARSAGAIVTQITQTMQIPLSYAEDIIGIGGTKIAYIRRTSGAIMSVQETRGFPEEITVEIKGTLSQVQAAQQLVQESIAGHKEPLSSAYSKPDPDYLSSYSYLGSSYPSSSLTSHSLGGYGSAAGFRGYGNYGY